MLKKIILFVGMFAFSLSYAGVSVIVHPSHSVSMSKTQVEKVFLGKSSSLPDGTKVDPVDQDKGSGTRKDFYSKVLGKSASKIKSYWAKRIFTGKGKPPETKGGDSDVKSFIAGNKGYIGYIDSSKVDSSVKVVLKVN